MELDDQEVLLSMRAGLPTLQFESLFTQESVKEFVMMRTISHATIMQHATMAGYFVRCLSLVRRLCAALHDEKGDTMTEGEELTVGICGCGRLGRTVAEAVLSCGGITPNQLRISTRRPELLESFKVQGVQCFFNNANLFTQCNVIFLCVGPNQLRAVCDQLTGTHLRRHTLIYSFVSGYNSRKLSRLLQTSNIIVTALSSKYMEYSALPNDDANKDSPLPLPRWNIGTTLRECLENREALKLLSPLHTEAGTAWFFDDNLQLMEQFTFAILNNCAVYQLDRKESLRVLNNTLLSEPFIRAQVQARGDSRASAREGVFVAQDCNLTQLSKQEKGYNFNLLVLDTRERRETGVRKKLAGDALVRQKFANTFIEAIVSSIKWLKFEQR